MKTVTLTLLFAIFFFGALAPGQTINVGEMKMLEGGVFASQDGQYLYLSAPVGTELRIGDTALMFEYSRVGVTTGHDDPWFITLGFVNRIVKIPSERLGVAGAGEVVIGVKQPSGEFIDQKVENIAGKVLLWPGDVTLAQGQLLRLATYIFGAPSEVRLSANFKELKLGEEVWKGTAPSGAVVTEYLEGFELPPGDWKVTFWASNSRGIFSDTIHVRVIPVQRLVGCCPNILK